MDLLQVIKHGESLPSDRFGNFITEDKSFLHLSYFKRSEVEDYDDFFDELNEYEVVTNLYFETDYINRLPPNIKKFRNLIKLTVCGSRFTDLNMTQVPENIQTLVLVEHSNLSNYCVFGMENLTNLRHLFLDFKPFCDSKGPPFVKLDKLEKIIFDGKYPSKINKEFIDGSLFNNIREDIKDVEIDTDRITIYLENKEIVIAPKIL